MLEHPFEDYCYLLAHLLLIANDFWFVAARLTIDPDFRGVFICLSLPASLRTHKYHAFLDQEIPILLGQKGQSTDDRAAQALLKSGVFFLTFHYTFEVDFLMFYKDAMTI
jgi:hypothetical protein